jgi:hypothetical protein
MAFRTWARILLAALGVAALAGASQLGVAYGLGVVRLTRVFDVAGRDQWNAQLAWAAWFAVVAAVVGALAGGHFHQRWARPAVPASPDVPPPANPAPAAGVPAPGLWTMVALAVAAGIGAAVVIPLTMQPARTAQVTAVNPALVIGICAGLGAIVGVFAGYAALAHVVARWSLGTMIGAVWVLAVVSVLPSLGPHDMLPAVRLGVFDAGFLAPATTQRFALFTMPALALLAGAGLGWLARRREFPPMTVALAGLPGPALVTFAYLIAGPGEGGERYQVVPYWAAMAAAGTGVLGAAIAAMIRRGGDEEPEPGDRESSPDGTGPTDTKPPLPRRTTGQPDPADETNTDLHGADLHSTDLYGTRASRPSDTGSFAAPATGFGTGPGGNGPGGNGPGGNGPGGNGPGSTGPGSLSGAPGFGPGLGPGVGAAAAVPAPAVPDPAASRPAGSGAQKSQPARGVRGALGRGLAGFRSDRGTDPASPAARPDDHTAATAHSGPTPDGPAHGLTHGGPPPNGPAHGGAARTMAGHAGLPKVGGGFPSGGGRGGQPPAPAPARPPVPLPALPPFPAEAAQPGMTGGPGPGRGVTRGPQTSGPHGGPLASGPHGGPARPVAPHIPEPRQVSPPPPHPTPVAPPPQAPAPQTGRSRPIVDSSGDPRDDGPGRRTARNTDAPQLRKKDVEYVDWVSGLGSD